MFAVRPLLSRCIRTEFSFLIKMAHMVFYVLELIDNVDEMK